MIRLDLNGKDFAPLTVHLLDLLHELKGQDIPLIVVGGYSLFLRRLIIEQTGVTTLYTAIPPQRATEDFDIVLKLELLADRHRVQALRAAFDHLGYEVVEGAEKYQFRKPGSAWEGYHDVKIDLLARTPGPGDPQLPYKGRRISTSKSKNPLHAHTTPEAIAVEDGLREIVLVGPRTTGEVYEGTVFLPAPYAIYLMKLFAFRDEEIAIKGIDREPYTRKHALDLYTLTALLTSDEYDALEIYRAKYGDDPVVQEAGEIVARYFSRPDSRGAIRLQEHGSFPISHQLPDFLALLAEFFPA